ncbi:MAG: PHP domain-containing protein [Desulfobacteraceae bacterium]|nr:PHP domain-containing protein [Desulfobacteraceae bacterium]
MFYIDMHVHTVLGGDSMILPEEVVPRACEAGLDAVCITEHHSWELSRPFDRIARRTGFPILRAMEYRAAEGHLLIYGVRAGKSDFPPGLPMQRVIDMVCRRGGAAVPAHPFQKGINGTVLGSGVLNLKNIAAIETENGSLKEEENQPARRAAEEMGVLGTGGSDAHGLHVLGRAYTVFPEPVTSEEDLVRALEKGGFWPEKNSESGPVLQVSACK